MGSGQRAVKTAMTQSETEKVWTTIGTCDTYAEAAAARKAFRSVAIWKAVKIHMFREKVNGTERCRYRVKGWAGETRKLCPTVASLAQVSG